MAGSALVTGASRGLGRAIALAFAEAGVEELTLVARGEPGLRNTAAAIDEQSPGVHVDVVACDVTRSADVALLFEHAGAPEIVVAAAGANVPQAFIDVDEDVLDRLIAINIKGTFLVLQHAARALCRAGRHGALIVIGSQMGHIGDSQRTVYCATKHAVEGLVKSAGVELAPQGIRVVSVAPTFVETPMTETFLRDEAFRESVLSRIPLGRLATVEDVASTVLFAASRSAAMITATSLLVDGGWTAR